MKFSPAQQKVINKMLAGWSICTYQAFGRRCWLQQGPIGIGEGGHSEYISYATVDVLFRKGIIKPSGTIGKITIFKLNGTNL